MTELEWLAGTDPTPLLADPRFAFSSRKLRLIGCGCCRRAWDLLTDGRSRHAVEAAEGHADGRVAREDLPSARAAADRAVEPWVQQRERWDTAERRRKRAAARSAAAVARPTTSRVKLARAVAEAAHHALVAEVGEQHVRTSRLVQHDLVRCVLGNPFRPVAADPAWLTSAVVALAAAIYADRAFDRLPVLADALEEAGCDHRGILSHCRGDDPHVRGCWVVDLVLGKE